MHRRDILTGLGATVLAGPAMAQQRPVLLPGLPDGVRDTATLERLPGKQNLIKLSYRPPNYETPIADFRSVITPNDRFFVRYHLAMIPDLADLKTWSLKIAGDAAARPITLSLDDLRTQFKTTEVTAVCQCAGSRRGLSAPHVPGVQWGPGAMGNAVWTGVRLKDVLDRAGVKPGAVEIGLSGADGPALDTTPAFHKSIPLSRAMQDEVILAFAMNHQPLPLYNGFPVRLIVPGWTATYWIKHLNKLDIRSQPLDSFWMQKSYRVPKNMFPVEQPFTTQEDAATAPITDIVVNSLITSQADGARVAASGFAVAGIAWDSGRGIRGVEVSTDGGANWAAATLGAETGKFSFRPFTLQTGKLPAGTATLLARATSNSGETQAAKQKFNPAGYHNNVPIAVTVTAV